MKRRIYILSCLLVVPAIGDTQTEAKPASSVQLSKVVLNTDVSKVTQHVKIGTVCLFSGKPIDFGSGDRTMNFEHYEGVFAEAMKKSGFNVLSKSDNLFDGQDSGPKPDFLVGASFQPQSLDICDSLNGVKGTVSIAVNWQVYDRSKQQVVETVTTAGTGQSLTFQMKGIQFLFDKAFTDSLDALIKQNVLQKYLGSPVAPASATTPG